MDVTHLAGLKYMFSGSWGLVIYIDGLPRVSSFVEKGEVNFLL